MNTAIPTYDVAKAGGCLSLCADVTVSGASTASDVASDPFFQQVFESTPHALLVVNGDAKIDLLNVEAERIFGYSRNELLGQPIDLLIPERFRAKHPVFRNRPFAQPSYSHIGNERGLFARRRDGSEFPVDIRLNPLPTDSGKYVLAAVVDIGRRKETERQIDLVFDAAPNGMVMVDGGGLIVLANTAMEEYFGYTREELIGQPIEILIPPRFRPDHPGKFRNFLAHPGTRALGAGRDLYGCRKDQSEFPVEIGLNPIPTAAGTCVLAAVVDISQRKQSEEELRNSQAKLLAALDAGGVGIWVWDIAHNRAWWDESTTNLLGRSPECLDNGVIDKFAAFLHPDDCQRVKDALENCARTGANYRGEYRLFRPDNTMLWIAARGKMELDVEGRPYRMVGACVDISDRKRADLDREKYAADLERINSALQSFVYVVSHDLGEPLRTILNYTQLMMEEFNDKLNDRARKYIRYIRDGSQRMALLIDDLLKYSRTDNSDEPMRPVSLDKILEEVMLDLGQSIHDCGAEIEVSELPTVAGSAVRLRQVFQNLMGNAIKFRDQRRPRIRVGFQARGNQFEITVADNGIGIKPQYFDRIFQIFQRLHTPQEYPGSGLGLAICKKIIEQHGGRIWAESELGQGSTFHFTLLAPRVDGDLSELMNVEERSADNARKCEGIQDSAG